ncbi:hypothetical protein [Polaribacter sp.]|uniref:hypothetical protein n=1 Tax=Polaribacter sp. TaxID=1920175 RepID=UPI003F6B9C42
MEYLAKKPILVIILFTIFFSTVLGLVFKVESTFIRSGIAAGLAIVLSPRKKKIKTQTGEKTQITWLFLKKPIILD